MSEQGTRQELVRRAIEFDHPWRMPTCSSPMGTSYTDDVVYVFPEFQGNKWWLNQGGADEWGCEWKLSETTTDMGQVVGHPLQNLRDISRLPRPNGNDPIRYRHLNDQITQADDRYVVFCNGTCLFERAHMLRGFEQFLTDLYEDPDGVDALLDCVIQYQIESVAHLATHFAGRIHAYRVTDDWGTQDASIISPALFRRHFFPRYKALFDHVHEAGMHVWFHSCGRHEDILEQLIEAGVDVANLCQPRVFDIPEFGRRFAGRVAFEGTCDMQTTLVSNDPALIRREANDLLTHWTTESGGWLLARDFPLEPSGIKLEALTTMVQAFLEGDPWGRG